MNTGVLTVRDLIKLAVKAFTDGHADKEIYLATDDEGNHFYPLQCGFTTDAEAVNSLLSNEMSPVYETDNIIILG